MGGFVSRTFPEAKEQKDVSCLALTAEFLIYGTRGGTITITYLPELQARTCTRMHTHAHACTRIHMQAHAGTCTCMHTLQGVSEYGH